MIRNILLSALASLKRKKMASLFTILTISLGMTMVVLSLAIYQSFTGNIGPYKQRDKCLFLSEVSFQLNGETVERDFLKYSTASFINNHLCKLQMPSLVGLYRASDGQWDLGSAYKKMPVKGIITDANFWKILQFRFLDGRPFNQEEVSRRAPVCVISRKAAEIKFGNVNAVGKYLQQYRIVGVIENEHPRFEVAADIYLPYTINPIDESISWFDNARNRNVYPTRGSFKAIVLANKKSDVKTIKSEFGQLVHKLNEQGKVEEFDAINAELKTANQLIPEFLQSFELSYSLFIALGILIFLLPIIILSNINQHALRDRLEEIGLRRAFGINRRNLFLHFLAENMLICFLGCLLALALSVPLFRFLSWVIFQTPHGIDFPFDWNAIIYLALGVLAFGFLTGVVPIIRISGVNPVKAIQNNSDWIHFSRSGKIYQKGVQAFTYFLLFFVLAIGFTLVSFYHSVTVSSLGYSIRNQWRIHVWEGEGSSIVGDEPKQVEKFNGLKEQLMHIDGVEGVSYMLEPCPLDGGTQPATKSFLIDGNEKQSRTLQVDTSFFDVLQIKPRKGKLFNGQDLSGKYLPAVVTLAAEKEFFAGDAMGKTFQLKENEQWYKVTGVIARYKHASGLKPLSAIILCRNKPSVGLIIRYKPTSNLMELGNSIDSLVKGSFAAREVRALKDDYLSQTQKTIPMFYGMLLVTGFILLNALFGYFTLSYYNVIGRKREMGIRRSMGAKKARIYLQVLKESLISMSLGTTLALLAVYQLKSVMLNGYVWEYLNSGLYLAIGISFITTIVTTLYPGYLASKVHPVEALAEE